MSLGAVVVVLIVSTAPADPAAEALELAAHELLGNSATIRVELTPRDLSNTEALQRAGKADGVVELVWTEDHARALLHCYVAHDDRWVDRAITFGAGDPAVERGRLLGFAIASMFPWLAAPQPGAPPPVEPVKSAAPSKDVGVKPRASDKTWQFELAGSATTGIRGPADAIGGTLGLRRSLSDTWSLRVGATGRVGDIAVAQASTRSGAAALGLAWAALPFDAIELGWRVDLVGSWLQVARARAADGQTERRSRWLLGGAAMVEGGYRFSPLLGLYAGAGTEALVGETDIYAEGSFAAKLPLFRVVGELGLRARL